MTKSAGKHLFEKGLERLEEIASLLDSEKVPLEEALCLYEEGMRLRASLSKYLAEAERRVTVMDMEPDSGTGNTPQQTKAARHKNENGAEKGGSLLF
ncbi:MAG: exodeoxyribonuclease VII small subunit [Spirochaetota bacterium]|jgi:exodeoxyribonuclease VII small subunit|nr:exodeoxyribonuclease VII small subunit [Spirochaetota bacterium]